MVKTTVSLKGNFEAQSASEIVLRPKAWASFKVLKAVGQDAPTSKPILEINLDHPLVTRLGATRGSARFADLAHVIFDQALLSEGGRLEDPAGFVRRLNEMLLAFSAPKRRRARKKTGAAKKGAED